MAFCSFVLTSSRWWIAGFFRGLCRVVLCLSLWTGPIPILHAHDYSGTVLDRDLDLAIHVMTCHSQADREECLHWHFHLVLWGEVLSSFPDSSSPHPLPQPKHLDSEFAVVSPADGLSGGYTEFEIMTAGAGNSCSHYETLITGDISDNIVFIS